MTKHPNYEFIVAFAEGKEVEYKLKGLDGAWDVWEKVCDISFLSDGGCYQYRLKPEKKKTVGYRRYVYKTEDECYVSTLDEVGFYTVEETESGAAFVKWIDLDWQYEEFEE